MNRSYLISQWSGCCLLWAVLVSGLLCQPASAKEPRSSTARTTFVKINPCPATGLPKQPCPGYIIDHVIPLCAGGEDYPGNMQWQTIEDAKVKDREERRMCKVGSR